MQKVKSYDDYLFEAVFSKIKKKIEKSALNTVFNQKQLEDIKAKLANLQTNSYKIKSQTTAFKKVFLNSIDTTSDSIGNIYDILSSIIGNIDYLLNKMH